MKKKLIFITILGLIAIPGIVSATLWSYYVEIGQNLPSVSRRAPLAVECGIYGYQGTAAQNLALEKCLRGGENGNLGANPVSRYKVTLTASMTSVQTTMKVSTMTTFDGHTLTMADLGNEVFLTIEPGGSSEEIVRCTGISSLTFTGCTRGLAFYGDSTTSVSANKKAHNAGSTVVMSNVHYIYPTVTKQNTWSALQTFGTSTESTTDKGFLAIGTSSQAYFKNISGVLYYCNSGASCAAIGAGSNTYNFVTPFTTTGSDIRLGTSTYDFVLRDTTLLGLATTTVAGGTASGDRLDDTWNDRYNATTTKESLTISSNLDVTGSATTTGFHNLPKPIQSMTCGESIGQYKAVYNYATSTVVGLADNTYATSTLNFVGISLNSCVIGGTVPVQSYGIFTNTSANYATNTLQFINPSGGFSSTTSTGAYIGIVGKAINSTQIKLGEPFTPYLSTAVAATGGGNTDLAYINLSVPVWANKIIMSMTWTLGGAGDVILYRYGKQNESFWGGSAGTGFAHSQLTCRFDSSANNIYCSSAETANDGNASCAGSGTFFAY